MSNLVQVPFDIELAKKITNGEIEGEIKTRGGLDARIICFDAIRGDYPIVALVKEFGMEESFNYTQSGSAIKLVQNKLDLVLYVPAYLRWKKGDVLCYISGNSKERIPFIFEWRNDSVLYGISSISIHSKVSEIQNITSDYGDNVFNATEEEKQQLFKVLAKEGKRWNPDTLKLEDIEKELPKSWEEYLSNLCNGDKCIVEYKINILLTIDNKYAALYKLELLRDCYRQGWLPDWNDNTTKFSICLDYGNDIDCSFQTYTNRFLSFPTSEIRTKFLTKFKDLIKEAGDLI